jgi:hypothetical protein
VERERAQREAVSIGHRARRPAVLVFAKEPQPGLVKTRLVPPLRPHEAADLAAAFLHDLVARLDALDARRVLAVPPGTSDTAMRPFLPGGWELADQGPGDLGAKLATATGRAFDEGACPVAVIGSDHPHLPPERLIGCLAAAEAGDVGWVTTDDGGFACLALPRALPWLFEAIPWSTPAVAAATRNNASRCGVTLSDFGPWYDLDRAEDIDRFLVDPESRGRCPATWTALRALEPPWERRRRSHG